MEISLQTILVLSALTFAISYYTYNGNSKKEDSSFNEVIKYSIIYKNIKI